MILRFRAPSRAATERPRAADRGVAEKQFELLQSQIRGLAKEAGRMADGLEETRAELKETRARLGKQIRTTKSSLTKEIRRADDRMRAVEEEVEVGEVRGHLDLVSNARPPVSDQVLPVSPNPQPVPSLPDEAEAAPPSNVSSGV